VTLVVVVKCVDGLVLAADSRVTEHRFDDEVPGSHRKVINDTGRKLHSFRAPFEHVGVLSFDYGAISAGFKGEETEIAAQTKRYSVETCIRKFKEPLYNSLKRRITVQEFRDLLFTFLIEYWQRYRDRRLSSSNATNKSALLPELEVKLLVAGFNEGEKEGHVFPIWLTDNNEFWIGGRYRGFSPCSERNELIRSPCGIFCDGAKDFVELVLAAEDPAKSLEKLQGGSTNATVAEIAAIRSRLDIRYVSEPRFFNFFSSADIVTQDAQRLADLLIKGTIAFYGEEGPVGGARRICTINPLTGTKCRKRS